MTSEDEASDVFACKTEKSALRFKKFKNFYKRVPEEPIKPTRSAVQEKVEFEIKKMV
jgi:hypothetical protein